MYKILSLDGGGSWALIQIKALQEFYGKDAKGHDVLKDFDLVVANSGGSIAMAAMLKNLSLDDILNNFYLKADVLKKIFVKLPPLNTEKVIRDIVGVGPRFSAVKKFEGLKEVLGDISEKSLDSLPALFGGKTNFIITAFDYDSRRAVFFRSNRNSQAASQGSRDHFVSVTLAEAIHASSNAPINFFDQPAQFKIDNKIKNFWDGAMGGYNNPIVAGVIEALWDKIPMSEISVLSIGTASSMLPIKGFGFEAVSEDLYQEIKKSSLLRDIGEGVTCVVDDPPDAASFIAYTMLGIPSLNKFVRLNPLIQPVLDGNKKWNYPCYDEVDSSLKVSPDEFHRLVNLDMAAIEEKDVLLINKYCDAWIRGKVNNQAIRTNPDLTGDIGFPYFKDGKDGWSK